MRRRIFTSGWLGSALALGAVLVGPRPAAAKARMLEPDPLPDRTYAESFTVVADLDDGTYVQSRVAITNLGVRRGRGACGALVVEPGRAGPWSASRVVDRQEWSYAATPDPVLAVGTCRLSATSDALSLVARFDSGALTVTLRRAPLRVAPPDHRVTTSSGFYDAEILVPWAAAEVSLAPAGRPARRVVGHGYADHSRSTTLPADLARGWVRFRALGDSCPALLLLRLPPGTAPARGWLLQGGSDSVPQAIEGAVTFPTDLDHPPSRLEVRLGDRTLGITLRQQLSRSAPGEELGALGRLVSRWIGLAVTTTHRASIDGLPGCDRAGGILELAAIQ